MPGNYEQVHVMHDASNVDWASWKMDADMILIGFFDNRVLAVHDPAILQDIVQPAPRMVERTRLHFIEISRLQIKTLTVTAKILIGNRVLTARAFVSVAEAGPLDDAAHMERLT
ncbi:hypothetical protein BA060_03235 [Brucella sp. B13-0095]|nr:hypothetical protein BA060_03235 [Brucella sp. B13-0095]